jgi:hypothetical protein
MFTFGKNMYLGHQCSFVKGHPYWRVQVAFNGQIENKFAPSEVSTTEFLRRVEECETWLSRKSNASKDKEDPIHIHGVERKNIIFSLPYWQVGVSSTNTPNC